MNRRFRIEKQIDGVMTNLQVTEIENGKLRATVFWIDEEQERRRG